MRIKPFSLALVIFIVMFGGIAATDIMDLWKTEGAKEPSKLTMSDNTTVYDPADIKGSYTMESISELYQVPLEDLLTAFGLTKDQSNIKCKDIEKQYEEANTQGIEIGPSSIRLFVAFYKQLQFEASEAYLTSSAAELLKSKISLSEEQLKYLESHTYHVVK